MQLQFVTFPTGTQAQREKRVQAESDLQKSGPFLCHLFYCVSVTLLDARIHNIEKVLLGGIWSKKVVRWRSSPNHGIMATPTFEISADSNVIKYYPQSPHNRHNIDSSTHHPDHRYLNQYPNHGIFYRGDISPNRVRSPSPNRPTRSSSPRFPSMGRFEGQRMASGSGAGRDISVQRIGQAVARRFVRTARRGNLPFIIIFVR